MSEQLSNIEIIKITFDAFNDRDFERANPYVHEDLEWTEVPSGNVFRGREGLQAEYKSWLRAFPDGKVEITNMIDGGDWVVAEYTVTGTNTGPFHGPDGTEIPPSGNKIALQACDVMHLRDGRVTGGRGYFDSAALKTD
jgi:steroid delta-isomerase-like uncharacterized protein